MKRGRRTTVGKPKAAGAAAAAAEVPKEPKVPTVIQVSGLQRPWSDEELKERLTSIADVEIVEFNVNASRSSATITLSDAESAASVIAELNNKPINDKPGAKPITIELYNESNAEIKMEVSEPEPAATSSTSFNAASPARAESIASFQQQQQQEFTETKGFLVTKTHPPLYFKPKSEEQVRAMRKRRNYDLDSTGLTGRFYANRERRRGGKDDPRPASSSSSNAMKTESHDHHDDRDAHSGDGGR